MSEMPVFRKFPDFRKFFSDASVQKYRQKCIFRKFSTLSGFFDKSDWHLCYVAIALFYEVTLDVIVPDIKGITYRFVIENSFFKMAVSMSTKISKCMNTVAYIISIVP